MQRITLLLLSLSSSFPLNAVATVHQVGALSGHLRPLPREQIVFPPANGPCLQNAGKVPLNCNDKDCIDIPLDGVCNIQTSTGLPICGCCPVGESVACSRCGGDAGGGQCKGSGTTGVAYQGCPCTDDSGDYPEDTSKVCPESNGQATAKCSDSTCAGDTSTAGVCDNQSAVKDQFGKGAFYTHCACCPDSSINDCNDCGGDAGGGKCSGTAASYGTPCNGCACGGTGGISLPPPNFPFPIPPAGFPPIPSGTPQPKQECSDTLGKCSDCEGNQGWCQSGENVGCPCQEDCPTGDDQPACSDETCKGDDTNKCTQGPQDGCDCTAVPDCPDEALAVAWSACGGTDSDGKCNGLSDHNNLWKGCDCWDDTIVDSEPYNPFGSAAGLQAAQAKLAGLPQLSILPPNSIASISVPGSSTTTPPALITSIF